MSDWNTTSDVLKNWKGLGEAIKNPLGPQVIGKLIALLLIVCFSFIYGRWKDERFKEEHPAAYQRQVLKKNLSNTNFNGWRIYLRGNGGEVNATRSLLQQSGVNFDQIEFTTDDRDSTALCISLFHHHHNDVENIDIADIPRYIQAQNQALTKSVVIELPESVNSFGMKFRQIPAGTFTMGDGSDAHQVTLTKPFMLGVYEVTQEQYERVVGSNPSEFKDPSNPVEQVSWDDAVEFCRKLSASPEEKSAGRVYRLPTEAEWEYCCRAGTFTEYSFGYEVADLDEYAWYVKNSLYRTHPVGQKRPNAWGLHDMHGNVSEWCSDWYGEYLSGSVSDPNGPQSGSSRVCRGGSWLGSVKGCRSASRSGHSRIDTLGFRVVCVPSGQ